MGRKQRGADVARSERTGSLAVRELDAVGPLAARWDALLALAPQPSPFASSWWIDSVDEPGRVVVAIEDGPTLVGGLALRRQQRGARTRFGILGDTFAAPDHVDAVAAPELIDEVARAIGDWLREQSPWSLHARAVAEDSVLGRAMAGHSVRLPFGTAPYLPLDGPPPAPRSSRTRTSLKRTRKRLQGAGLEHRCIDATADAAEVERALSELVRLHRQRWPQGSNFLRGLPGLLPVVRAGVAAGSVGIHELVVGDVVAVSMLTLDVGGRRCFYQSGRDLRHELRGAGVVLFDEVIGDAVRRGLHEFDFLRGTEPYKLEWTDRERPLVDRVGGQGPTGLATAAAVAAPLAARIVARRARDRLAAVRHTGRGPEAG